MDPNDTNQSATNNGNDQEQREESNQVREERTEAEAQVEEEEEEKNNDDDSSDSESSIEEINELRRNFFQLPEREISIRPRSWADVHSITYMSKNTSPLTHQMLSYPTLVSDPIDVVLLAQEFSPLSFITIASGEKHNITCIHSLHFFHENEDARCIGIIGARDRGTAINVNTSQLFKLSTASVPSLEAFLDCALADEDPTEARASTDIKICNSIPVPSQFASLVMKNTPKNAGIILSRILEACVRTDVDRFKEKEPEKAHPELSDMIITAAHLPLFQHLYAYSKMKSPRQIGFSISDDEYANNWVSEQDAQFLHQTTREEHSHHNPRTSEPNSQNNPHVSWDSEQNQNPGNNRRTETNEGNHFTFTGSPNAQYQRSTAAQTPPNQGSNHQVDNDANTRSFVSALESMTNNQSRFTHSMERLVNATASKFNDDGTKKIGNIIKEVVCNASTNDGQNPSPELTPFAKDVLSLPGDQPLILLNILFHKNKIRAQPTPKFIAAMRKGNLTYDSACPDGLSISQLPQSLAGTEFEDLDISRLLNMEENGTITEADTLNLNKSVLQVSKTMHYLQDKAKAWSTFCEAYFGDDSYVHLEADSWVTWIDENFNELQEIKATRDKDLPVKIEVAISEQFNRIFRSSMLGVPTESLFYSNLRDGILNNSTFLTIPSAVKAIVDRSNKRKNENNNNGGPNNKRAKGVANKVTHDNQPKELSLTQDQYRTKAIPYIQQNKEKLPKFDNNTDECMKFTLLGHCNADCPRCGSHKPVKKGTQRHERLVKLRNDILQSNPSKSQAKQDFVEGEGN
eukprot:scaffold209200_cov45-Cyclotella_meneghiniana.AAC.1